MPATYSALFIDDQYLKDYTPMGQNIDPLQIYPFVEDAQEIYIQDLLGTPLYMDLTYQLYIGTTYSTADRALVDLCSKCLAYWTVYMALPHLAIKIRNVGVARPTSENTQPSTMEELKYIREEMKNMAEFWAERIVRYLCDNKVTYPLYTAASDDIYPSSGQYDSDIYLDDYSMTNAEIEFLKKYYRQ